MTEKDAGKIVRQRVKPRIYDFGYLATRSHHNAFLRFKNIVSKTNKPLKVIDIGCGYKPFKELIRDVDIKEYIGVDFDTNRSGADIVAPINKIPLPDNSFDVVITSEVLEHALYLEESVSEMRRLSVNGALIYISTPFVFGEHGIPYDFQRITSYKYQQLFSQDEILELSPTNSSFSTPFYAMNLCFEAVRIPAFSRIVHIINNCLAMAMEVLGVLLSKFIDKRLIYNMPAGYDVIIRVKK